MTSTATALPNEAPQAEGQQAYENLQGETPKTAIPQAPTEAAPQAPTEAPQAQAQTDGPALGAPPSKRASLAGSLAAGPAASLSNVNADLKKALYENPPPALANAFEQLEKKTGAKREHVAYGAVGLLALYLIVGSAARLVCNVIGFAYPAYASVKAIRTEQKDDDTQWLIYWATFATFSLLDFFSEGIMGFLPIYWLAKTAFLLYLSLPATRGAERLYAKLVDPLVTKLDALLKARAEKAAAQ